MLIGSTTSAVQGTTGLLGAAALTDAQKAKLEEGKKAVAVLQQLRTAPTDGVKGGDARQKVEAVRQQFQRLQLLGASFKQVTTMANQLASAVKEYAAARSGTSASSASATGDDSGSATGFQAAGAPDGDMDRLFFGGARLLATQLRIAARQPTRKSYLWSDSSDAVRAADSAATAIDRLARSARPGGISISI